MALMMSTPATGEPDQSSQSDVVPVEEAAKTLGIPVGRIRGWVNREQIVPYYPGLGRRKLHVSLREIRAKLALRPGN